MEPINFESQEYEPIIYDLKEIIEEMKMNGYFYSKDFLRLHVRLWKKMKDIFFR